jgi:hypothetical protein
MGSNVTAPWRDDEITLIKRLWNDEGLSAGDCVQALWNELRSSRSRNAVIGVIHRKKAEFVQRGRVSIIPAQRRKVTVVHEHKRRLAPVRQASAALPPPKPVDRNVYDAGSKRLPLEELGWQDCRFPVNDAAPGETHLFCGRPQRADAKYCPHHCERAYAGYSARAA